MVFVCMREHDAANITRRQAVLSQTRAQRIDGFACLRASIDDRDRIFFDEIDVNRANVERSWK